MELIINQYTSPVSGLTSTAQMYGMNAYSSRGPDDFVAYTTSTNHYVINAQHKYTDFSLVWADTTSSQMQLW